MLEEIASTKCSTRFDNDFEYDRLRLFEKVPFCMTRPKATEDGEGGIGGFVNEGGGVTYNTTISYCVNLMMTNLQLMLHREALRPLRRPRRRRCGLGWRVPLHLGGSRGGCCGGGAC